MNSDDAIFPEALYTGSGFTDAVFAEYVSRWMDRNMPGFPMGLLGDENEDFAEKFQLAPRSVHEVQEIEYICYECSECGESINRSAALPEPPHDCEVDGEKVQWSKVEDEGYVVYNTDTSEYVEDGGDEEVVSLQGIVTVWVMESDAKDHAEQLDQEANEDGHGFPWAHSWCFMPERFITDEDLHKAGFRVATYCPSGRWGRHADTYRLAGIDGGGYAFKEAHYGPLVVAWAERINTTVPTQHGDRYVTTDRRTVLEQLADLGGVK